MLDELANGNPLEVVGVGYLTLEDEEGEQWEPGTPVGPGKVHFTLAYDPARETDPHTRSLKVELVSLDASGDELLRWSGGSEPHPSPRYGLTGKASANRGEDLPVRMESVTLTSSLNFAVQKTEGQFREYIRALDTLARMDGVIEETESEDDMTEEQMEQVFSEWLDFSNMAPLRHGIVRKVTLGVDVPAGRFSKCKMFVPNFAGYANFEAEGMKFNLFKISDAAQLKLDEPEYLGKVLPVSYLDIERVRGTCDVAMETAVYDVGWFLSFYAGRRIHPVAWEGISDQGRTWCLESRQITPIGSNKTVSCLDGTDIGLFLKEALGAWQMKVHEDEELAQELRRSLRGASNLYADILATTFPTQRVALTAMYLERFRVSVFGNSSLIEIVNQGENRVDENELARLVRETLVERIDDNEVLTPQEKEVLQEPILKMGVLNIRGLFRKSFKNSIVELYAHFGLSVDKKRLQLFINERNSVVHGYWDSGREGTLETERQARFGLHLLEKLILKLFGHEGKYLNRMRNEYQHFP
jgi:hypothetical protein